MNLLWIYSSLSVRKAENISTNYRPKLWWPKRTPSFSASSGFAQPLAYKSSGRRIEYRHKISSNSAGLTSEDSGQNQDFEHLETEAQIVNRSCKTSNKKMTSILMVSPFLVIASRIFILLVYNLPKQRVDHAIVPVGFRGHMFELASAGNGRNRGTWWTLGDRRWLASQGLPSEL